MVHRTALAVGQFELRATRKGAKTPRHHENHSFLRLCAFAGNIFLKLTYYQPR